MKFKVRLKEGSGNHHRREAKTRVVYRPGDVFEVDQYEYDRIKDKVERLDVPHPKAKEEPKVKTKAEPEITKEDTEDTTKEESESTPEQVKSPRMLVPVGELWNVVIKATKSVINDKPLSLTEAQKLL